jgi:hypothetical protein
MPNITKYMGRAIPGMSVIRGAWDAGQGVSSLVEALQRRAAKQSGGPVPMEDIGNWLQKNYTPEESFTIGNKTYKLPAGDKPTHERRSYRTKWSNQDPRFSYIEHPRALGMKEKPLMDDVSEFWQANKSWDDDVSQLLESLQALKREKKLKAEYKKDAGDKWTKADERDWKQMEVMRKHQLQDKLGQYLQSQSDLNKGIEHKTKAKDSIWMSVLDAMKRQEKK